jgi:hypothetical protein
MGAAALFLPSLIESPSWGPEAKSRGLACRSRRATRAAARGVSGPHQKQRTGLKPESSGPQSQILGKAQSGARISSQARPRSRATSSCRGIPARRSGAPPDLKAGDGARRLGRDPSATGLEDRVFTPRWHGACQAASEERSPQCAVAAGARASAG